MTAAATGVAATSVAATNVAALAWPEVWRLPVQLAAALARPLDHGLVATSPWPSLPDAALGALVRHPPFRRPLNRALSRALDLGLVEITPDVLGRLRTQPRTRLCVLIASQPMALVREAAIEVGAAILHKHVVRVVLKADRERLRAAFGEAGFQIATQEALLLHAPLAGLALPSTADAVLDPALAAGAARERLVDLGLATLAAFVDAAEPALGRVVALRVAATLDPATRGLCPPGRFTPEHGDHIVRLLRRRIRAWSAPIG